MSRLEDAFLPYENVDFISFLKNFLHIGCQEISLISLP